MEHASLHARARDKGVNPLIYWLVRGVAAAVLPPLLPALADRARARPRQGPVILASNHRSFLDPFVIATIARRPLYYVAKEELFTSRFTAWLLNNLGAFPVRRGEGDADMIDTAKAILARGDAVLIFAEGTRIRPGALGRPRRGVGRLALETGAPVVPVADDRHRGRAQGLAHPAAQGPHPRRPRRSPSRRSQAPVAHARRRRRPTASGRA